MGDAARRGARAAGGAADVGAALGSWPRRRWRTWLKKRYGYCLRTIKLSRSIDYAMRSLWPVVILGFNLVMFSRRRPRVVSRMEREATMC